jgi:hypothetical protein
MTWRLEYGRRVPKSLARLPLDDHRRIVEALAAMQDDPLSGDVQVLRTSRPVTGDGSETIASCLILS